jgi:hypothetical protein
VLSLNLESWVRVRVGYTSAGFGLAGTLITINSRERNKEREGIRERERASIIMRESE